MGVQGIYVSEAQGNVEWNDIKDKGVEFALICAGRGAGEIDLQFRKNAWGCRTVGIDMGVCWLSYADTPDMAEREADYCAQTIEEFRVAYPVCFAFTSESIRYAESRGSVISEELAYAIRGAFVRRMRVLGYGVVCCDDPVEIHFKIFAKHYKTTQSDIKW